jgi:hypothetical protein
MPDNFFGVLQTESCECGHNINVTNPGEHTCNADCDCDGCRERITRQLRVMEED